MTLASSSTDPFELDRLAEELVTRELDKDATDHELPIYIPLSHTNPHLTSDVFDVEAFLLSRSHTSLRDLRSELRDYLATLKEELVQLINDDYEAFISLSTDLRGEGERLERLQSPLADLRQQALESKRELQVIQDAIQESLEKRSMLREEKALLHLLLKISESVTRLESLLLIASSTTEENERTEMDAHSTHLSLTEDSTEDRDRTRGQAKHLSRVAAEYSQLLYHASKARAENCVFVDEIQWRIDRIRSTLSSDLDHLFSVTLTNLTTLNTDTRLSELEKTKSLADLKECLHTYDTMGLWRDAEDVLRRDLVRRFVKRSVFSGALAAPPSPMVPHTPFRSSTSGNSALEPNALPPRTPYTPFTAFALRTPFQSTLGSDTSPYSHLLEDDDDPLARLYTQILRFVERDLKKIMVIADELSNKNLSAKQGRLPSDAPSGDGFEILANVVWEELGRAIMDELGVVVFASGRPNEFRKHYEITQAFVRSLEYLAPSVHAVEAMRAHPVYGAFERRWQLPVYYQLRWKEIASKVEEALASSKADASTGDQTFVTTQAQAIWIAISACWSAEVFIPELAHRFWRLTLQLLSRYRVWLDSTLDDKPVDKGSASIARSGTPVDGQSADSLAADDSRLRQYALIIADVRALRASVMRLWKEEISLLLPELSGDDRSNTEETLSLSLSALGDATEPMSSHVVAILTKRCCDALNPVRSISSHFRAMANKSMPKAPSDFVSSVLKPVKGFFGIGVAHAPGAALVDHCLEQYTAEIFESVSQRYVYLITGMKKTEESLRRLKKGKKNTFSLFGSSAKDDDGKDEERIRTQMILDVEAFGVDAQSLGVAVSKSECFKSLQEMVHAPVDPSE